MTADDDASAGNADTAPIEITVLSGDPTPQELAAVTAVLSAIAQETADDARLDGGSTRSAWQLSQLAARPPLKPGPGAWQRFGA